MRLLREDISHLALLWVSLDAVDAANVQPQGVCNRRGRRRGRLRHLDMGGRPEPGATGDELRARSRSHDPRQRGRPRVLPPARCRDGRSPLPAHGPDARPGPPQRPQPGHWRDSDRQLVRGYAEREQPLLLPHEVLQLDAEHVVAFAGGTPPARLERIDWRSDRALHELAHQPAPVVPVIPETLLADWPQPPARRISSAGTGSRSLDD